MGDNDYKSRKQIDFDLNEKLLKENYPRPHFTINPRYYTKAWADISKFMDKSNWEHRQKSVYASNEQLSTLQVGEFLEKMAREMPWLYKCTDEIDITDIGDKQHSLKQALEDITKSLEIAGPEIKKTDIRNSMREWNSKINDKRNEKGSQEEQGFQKNKSKADKNIEER